MPGQTNGRRDIWGVDVGIVVWTHRQSGHIVWTHSVRTQSLDTLSGHTVSGHRVWTQCLDTVYGHTVSGHTGGLDTVSGHTSCMDTHICLDTQSDINK